MGTQGHCQSSYGLWQFFLNMKGNLMIKEIKMKDNKLIVAILILVIGFAIYFAYNAGKDKNPPGVMDEIRHEADEVKDQMDID